MALEAEPSTRETPQQSDFPAETGYQHFRVPDSLAELDDLTKEGLWLYEKLMSLDESGESLCTYRDSGKAPFLQEDIRMLEGQIGAEANEVISFYNQTTAVRERVRRELSAIMGKDAPVLQEIAPMPWLGKERESGRQSGLSIGWPMLLNPHEDSAQALLDNLHGKGGAYLLAKAKKVGVGHIFVLDPDAASWRGCEPTPGHYDFATLDKMLDEVNKNGLKAMLFIPSLTTACPAWFKDPSGGPISFVGIGGVARSGAGVFADVRRSRDEFAMFQEKGRDHEDASVNLYNPAVRQAFQSYLRALGEHLNAKYRNMLLAIQLETNFVYFLSHDKSTYGTDIDYSPFARESWRAWLRAKYQNVSALNTAWKSNVSDWNVVELVKPVTFGPLRIATHGFGGASSLSDESAAYVASLSPREWNDFLDWREDYVTGYFKFQADALRGALPGIPISMDVENLDGHIPLFRREEYGWNGAKLTKEVLDFPQSMSTAEWAHHLLRAYAEAKNLESPPWIADQGEKTFGSLIAHAITSPYYKDAIVLNHRFGPGEVLRYFHDIGAYNYMDEQLTPDGANSWFLAMREDHAVAPEILNTQVAKGQIAVLWPSSSFRWDPDTLALREAECWADALHCVGYGYDYLLEHNLTEQGLKGYKALVLPAAWCLSDTACAAIEKFVRGGGALIATSAPGLRNELGELRPSWPFAALTGVGNPQFMPMMPVTGTPLGIVQPEGWWEQDGLRTNESDLTYASRLCCTYTPGSADGLQVLSHFSDGRPAVIQRGVGRGRVLLLGYPFGSEYGWSNYNEIGFGKIHGDTTMLRWQRALEAWLRDRMHGLGMQPVHEALTAITLRPDGRENERPSLGFPQGGSTFDNYQINQDEYDRTIEFTLRERTGVPTKYLCVWNRESDYGASRGYVHHFAAPKYLAVRVAISGVQSIVDIALRTPVKFERQGDAVVFRTSLAHDMGRVFAISTEKTVTLFSGVRSRGISDAELLASVRSTAVKQPQPRLRTVHPSEVRAFLAGLRGKTVTIGCGSPAYRALGDRLAVALAGRLHCKATCTLTGVQYSAEGQKHRKPHYTMQGLPDILLGNEWDNQILASYTATSWPDDSQNNKNRLFLPVVINRAYPGAGSGVLELSRPYQVVSRRKRATTEPQTYRFDPTIPRLVIGGSDIAGTELALSACIETMTMK